MNLKSIEQNSVSLCLLSDVKMAGQIFPKLEDVLGIDRYVDVVGNKPISLLNSHKIVEPEQNFFVGIVDAGLDIRVVISIGVNEGENISSISFNTPSSEVATYDGYEKGIIYIDEARK